MDAHQLDLLENAVDSLNESLIKFEKGDQGDHRAYKFAVLHMAHFLELVFKHHVAQQHPLLIYKEPFAEKLNVDRTITLWDAINFISNERTNSISRQLRRDLEWLKKLRNQIEHHKFAMNVAEVRSTMGRLFRAVLEFLEDHSEIDVSALIPNPVKHIFENISDEYKFDINVARLLADQIVAADRRRWEVGEAQVRYDCPECGNPFLVRDESAKWSYKCTFCKNEYSEELPAPCSICCGEFPLADLEVWDQDDAKTEYRCYYCSGRYSAEKDD